MKLYDFFRSSAAFRVRIALNLKNISHDTEHINLQAGDQTGPEYLGVNPQGRVPALSVDGGVLLQSLAIIEYLDETHPSPLFCHRTRWAARASAPLRGLSPATFIR